MLPIPFQKLSSEVLQKTWPPPKSGCAQWSSFTAPHKSILQDSRIKETCNNSPKIHSFWVSLLLLNPQVKKSHLLDNLSFLFSKNTISAFSSSGPSDEKRGLHTTWWLTNKQMQIKREKKKQPLELFIKLVISSQCFWGQPQTDKIPWKQPLQTQEVMSLDILCKDHIWRN